MNYSEGSLLEDVSMASLVDSDDSDAEELDDTVLSGNISFEPPAHSSLQSLQASLRSLQASSTRHDRNASSAARGDSRPRRTPVKLPEFWQDEPVIWFEQAEAQFRRGGVTDERSMADHLLVALPPSILRSIRDILQERADDSIYRRLKKRLLGRFAPSKWQLVFSVLDHPGLGDMKPSQLLDGMLALLPVGEPPGLLFQGLFLRRLPAELRDHLAAKDFPTIRDMAAVADKLWDARREGVASGINAVGRQAAQHGGKGRRRSPSQTPRDFSPGADGYCWYHASYAAKAKKCKPPCSWAGNGPAAGGN